MTEKIDNDCNTYVKQEYNIKVSMKIMKTHQYI